MKKKTEGYTVTEHRAARPGPHRIKSSSSAAVLPSSLQERADYLFNNRRQSNTSEGQTPRTSDTLRQWAPAHAADRGLTTKPLSLKHPSRISLLGKRMGRGHGEVLKMAASKHRASAEIPSTKQVEPRRQIPRVCWPDSLQSIPIGNLQFQ